MGAVRQVFQVMQLRGTLQVPGISPIKTTVFANSPQTLVASGFTVRRTTYLSPFVDPPGANLPNPATYLSPFAGANRENADFRYLWVRLPARVTTN
jgi:hypothetical protein